MTMTLGRGAVVPALRRVVWLPMVVLLVTVVLVVCGLASGCVSTPPVTVRNQLPMNSEVAVVMFRDCAIPGQEEDCTGSGLTAGSIFARVFSEKPGLRAVPLSRPVAATVEFDDSAAVAYAKSKGYQYVINGDVEDYYRVAPMTFRTERAGVSVHLLRTSDGEVLAFFSHRTHSQTNLTTPDAMLASMAEHVRDSVSPTAVAPNR